MTIQTYIINGKIRAHCASGSRMIPMPDHVSGAAAHRHAVHMLLLKLRQGGNHTVGWAKDYTQGELGKGYVFVRK